MASDGRSHAGDARCGKPSSGPFGSGCSAGRGTSSEEADAAHSVQTRTDRATARFAHGQRSGKTSDMLTLSTEDYLWFVDQALDEMARIVTELGDEDGNRRPDLPDANSPFAVLTHCLGVLEFWPRTRSSTDRSSGTATPSSGRRDGRGPRRANPRRAPTAGRRPHGRRPVGRASDTTRSTRRTWARPSRRRRAGSWSTCCERSRSTSARWRSRGTCCSRRETARSRSAARAARGGRAVRAAARSSDPQGP